MRKVGFVVVNYNDFLNTSKIIDNIKNYSSIHKIVVVDNCSLDNSYSDLKKLENKKIVVLKSDSNHLAHGWNLGAKYLVEHFGCCDIIFSNADILVYRDEDLVCLLKDLKKDSIGVVAPFINEHGTVKKAWPIPTVGQEILFNLPLVSRYFKKKYMGYPDSYYDKKLVRVGVVSGCFFLVKSEVLEEIRYFDSNTHLYYEENIFAVKISHTNYHIAIDPSVEVLHDHSVSIDKSIRRIQKYKILKESQRYFVKKYLHANFLELFLLFLTNKISLFILYIRVFLKK